VGFGLQPFFHIEALRIYLKRENGHQ
jgi:hypothetical protein